MQKQRLVILSDYGLDDAVAGAYLLSRADMFCAVDIVAVAGNVSAQKSLFNAKKLVSAAGAENKKVVIVDTCDIAQHGTDLPSIHGADGMGDLFDGSIIKSGLNIVPYNKFFKSLSDGFILLSLGPLTLTEQILKKFKPSLTLIMAGMVDEVPNFNGMEFNQALDAQSYNNCLKFDHVAATLDTCRDPAFNLAGKRFEENCLMNKFINRAIALAEARHPDNSYIYDFIASLYLTEPKLFKTERVTDKWGNTLSQLKIDNKNFKLCEFVAGARKN